MHIERMTATFGRLQNETLSLKPGLNCIYAPNESGKSTWTHFLLNMLYGMNTRDRSPYAHKNRYQPWSGSAMQGVMDVVRDGRSYTLSRTTRRANAPMGAFRLTYGGTGDDVPGVTASDAGEYLLGVPREVYERSAFIAQSGLAVQQSAELERRILALITTGEEDISYSQTMKALRDSRNRRKHNRTGLIPALEEQCRSLEGELRELSALEEQRRQAREQLRAREEEVRVLRDYDARWQVLETRQEAAAIARRRANAEQKLRELRERAVRDEAACTIHPLHGVGPEELDKRLHPAPPKKPLPFWPGLGVMACSPLLLLTPWAGRLLLAAAVFAAGAAAAIFLWYRRRDYLAALAAQQRAAETLQSQHAEYRRLCETARRSHDDWAHYKQLWDELPVPPPISPEYAEQPPIPRREVSERLRRAEEDVIRCRTRRDTAAGRLTALGSAPDKQASLRQKQEQIALLQGEYDAITLAMETLDDANQVIQSRFSPALGARAAQLFSRLTGGRYEKVTLSRSFDLAAATGDDAVLRALPLLSQGAADQLYLAVRLAVCEMVLPCRDAAPLVLDDALLSFDDQRMAAALELLTDMAKTRQILLFTCQRREQACLQDRPGVHLLQL